MILSVNHIEKSFDGLNILKDVSFSLEPGTLTAIFGENGSGKTTLFHILTGFLKPDKGELVFKGQNITGRSPIEIAYLGIGRVWQTPRICKNLTVMENLVLASRDHPGELLLNYFLNPGKIIVENRLRKQAAVGVARQVLLSGKLGKTAGSLSFGQQKLLSIGMLVMSKAELLALDEPFAGINGVAVDHIATTLKGLKESGKTILMVEHNYLKAREIADRVIRVNKGIVEND